MFRHCLSLVPSQYVWKLVTPRDMLTLYKAAISPLTGAIVARIIKRIGYRKTAMTGSFLLGLGEFCAGFSTNSVPAMFATQGFLFGIGAALLFLVSLCNSFDCKAKRASTLIYVNSQLLLCRPFGSKGNEDSQPASSTVARESDLQ